MLNKIVNDVVAIVENDLMLSGLRVLSNEAAKYTEINNAIKDEALRKIRWRRSVSNGLEEDRGKDGNRAGNRSNSIWNSAEGGNEGHTDWDDVIPIGTSCRCRRNQISPYDDVPLK